MVQLNIGPFDNLKEFNSSLGVSPRSQYWKYANRDHLIYAPALGYSVYLVKRMHDKFVSGFTVINLTEGTTFTFKDVLSMTKHVFGRSYDLRRVFFKYILTGRICKVKVGPNQPDQEFIIRFTEPADFALAQKRFGDS